MIKCALLAAAAAVIAVAAPTLGAASTATPCVFLVPDVSETFVNRCPACVEVSVERTRAGEALPDRRTMMVPRGRRRGTLSRPGAHPHSGRTRLLAAARARPLRPAKGVRRQAERQRASTISPES